MKSSPHHPEAVGTGTSIPHSLSVDWYPVPQAYELIETFLCTPATHALTFGEVDEMDAHDEEEGGGGSEEKEVRGRKEIIITTEMQEMVKRRKTCPDQKANQIKRRRLLPQPLPETNAQFKFLELMSPGCLCPWLFCTEHLPLPAQPTRKRIGGVADSWTMVVL